MRKRVSFLLPVLVVIGLVFGCGEDPAKPTIRRLTASEVCGVAPLRVDFRGDASGGEALSDPSGSNNWLKFTWDFGDGTVIDNATSIAYHEYPDSGTYTVTLTAEDDSGEKAHDSIIIEVKQDSLVIDAFAHIAGTIVDQVETCEPIWFGITAEACGFDPVSDSYERFVHRWYTRGDTLNHPSPEVLYGQEDVGDQTIVLVLEDPVRSITRVDTVAINVQESGGADLALTADWSLTPGGVDSSTFDRVAPSFPDTLTISYFVTNRGPANAYYLEVQGELDGFVRILHIGHEANLGSYVFDGDEEDTWTWLIDAVDADQIARLDITFVLEQSAIPRSYYFDAALAPYSCDYTADDDDGDLDAAATLNIIPDQ